MGTLVLLYMLFILNNSKKHACLWQTRLSLNGKSIKNLNPAATYPPGPSPAKYYRRIRA